MVWSAVVVHLPAAGFGYTANQLFWLAALPALSGATLRIFYAFVVLVFGGRRVTALPTASLLQPALGGGFAVPDPTTPCEVMVGLALLAGLGGGNFVSSMAHISFFCPKSRKGHALGMNVGLGNLGVALVQMTVAVVIAAGVFGFFGGGAQATEHGRRLRGRLAGGLLPAVCRRGHRQRKHLPDDPAGLPERSAARRPCTAGGPEAALACFVAFYLTCIAITWWFCSRRYAPMPC
jgi:NNP family nitrate/nitrite transporter-like MFS transporter